MSDYHNKHSAEILKTIIYATVATASKDGQPWNSPVRFNYDNEINIYWASDKDGQHSKNIRENGNAFIVIYDSTVPEGEGEGVYIKAKTYELNSPEEIVSYRNIKKGPADHDPNEFLGDAIRRVYKAVPQQVWMNDAEEKNGVFLRDYRVEVPLDELKVLLGQFS